MHYLPTRPDNLYLTLSSPPNPLFPFLTPQRFPERDIERDMGKKRSPVGWETKSQARDGQYEANRGNLVENCAKGKRDVGRRNRVSFNIIDIITNRDQAWKSNPKPHTQRDFSVLLQLRLHDNSP